MSHIFISYSSKDADFCKIVKANLEAAGFEVWVDMTKIQLGDTWRNKIDEGIKSSFVVIVILSPDAINSKYVTYEWAYALGHGIAILPILHKEVEKTDLHPVLEVLQYMDCSKHEINWGYLVDKVRELLPLPAQVAVEKAWGFKTDPDYNNTFLQKNNYLDREANDFAQNEWTNRLALFNYETGYTDTNWFVSFVAVPLKASINIDLSSLNTLMNFQQPPFYYGSQEKHELFINMSPFIFNFEKQAEKVFYSNINLSVNKKRLTDRFMRFNRTGAIECGISTNNMVYQEEDFKDVFKAAYNFMYILGFSWKFLNMATNLYHHYNYSDGFQFLVNIKNSSSSSIAHFARSSSNQLVYKDFVEVGNSVRKWTIENLVRSGAGLSHDKNIQFVVQVSTSSVFHQREELKLVVDKLSYEIQRCFGYKPSDRHLHNDTGEFAWRQYYASEDR